MGTTQSISNAYSACSCYLAPYFSSLNNTFPPWAIIHSFHQLSQPKSQLWDKHVLKAKRCLTACVLKRCPMVDREQAIGFYILSGHIRVRKEDLERVTREIDLWVTLLSVLPLRSGSGLLAQNRWIDAWIFFHMSTYQIPSHPVWISLIKGISLLFHCYNLIAIEQGECWYMTTVKWI